MNDLIIAILLGIVEGITEFLPVSSTGHLILASELMGYDAARWATFNVVIQLGAILAIVVLYWRTFWTMGMGLLRWEPESVRFVRNILLGFLPSAILGLIFIDRIEAMLGEPGIVAWALILGGIAILAIERWVKPGDVTGVANIPISKVLGVGLIQCLSMVPGVSRSGATILGALSLGVERRTAAEFSFFLAIPTMMGATTLGIIKDREALFASGSQAMTEIAIGFVVSFIVAILVVKWFIGIVGKYGFGPFAWYRIAAGGLALIWLAMR